MPQCVFGRRIIQGRKFQQCLRDEYWQQVTAGEIPHPYEEDTDEN